MSACFNKLIRNIRIRRHSLQLYQLFMPFSYLLMNISHLRNKHNLVPHNLRIEGETLFDLGRIFRFFIIFIKHVRTLLHYHAQHVMHFFKHKRQRPSEHIHAFGQQVRMVSIIELFNVKVSFVQFYYGTFVIIDITIVRSTEYGYYVRELGYPIPLVKLVATLLHLMGSNYPNDMILL